MRSRSRSLRRRLAGLAAFALAATGLAGASATPARAASLTTVAYAVDYNNTQMDEVDVATNRIISETALPYNANQVAASPDNSAVYVSSTDLYDMVSVIDPATAMVQRTIPVCPGSGPGNLTVTPDSSQLWVGCTDGTIDVIDTASATVKKTITAPGVLTQVQFSRDGSTAYGDVKLSYSTSEVAVIATGSDTIAGTIAVQGEASGLALNPDGSALFVPEPLHSTVAVIDTSTLTPVAEIATPSTSDALTAVNPAHTAFYLCRRDGTLDIVDLVNRVLTTVLQSPCGYGASMAVTPDGNELYSADGYFLNVVNASTGQLVTSLNDFSSLDSVAIGRVAFPPSIYIVNPLQGPETGGTSVTITGRRLTGTTAVLFGGVPSPSFTVNNDNLITAVSPPHVEGPVDITVYTQNGANKYPAENKFTYTEIPPTVTGLSPSQGVSRGGTTVTITGTDFNTATGVNFGGTAASWFTVDSDTQITAVTRAQTNGTVDVTVTNAAGTSPATAADKFTFFPPIPSITAVSPPSGTMDGGTTVIISGAWFTNAFRVTFGNTAAASFHVDSSTQITAVTPYHAAGAVDVSVTTDVDTSPVVASDQYTFMHSSQ
ncbi:YVTN family beta-propeller protein [Catenulispora sp. GAS73]|uniref:IPT/TIG domain-containing protein n=1 Tax=Catenulispora sp. GAS73 TaxID=3156269 RepID=UPI00351970C2